MTDRLYRTEQARSHLIADVAHELRTPLTIIQGQMELIQQGIKNLNQRLFYRFRMKYLV
jgi:two-component system, OmpR family, sensor histidine kinase BaeS